MGEFENRVYIVEAGLSLHQGYLSTINIVKDTIYYI